MLPKEPEGFGALEFFKDQIVLKSNPTSVSKKKKKKVKKEKMDELEPLRYESRRLNTIPNWMKPYHFKPEGQDGDTRIIKFSKIPKN